MSNLTVTADDVLRWNPAPCLPEYSAERIRELMAAQTDWGVQDFARLDISAVDFLWVVMGKEVNELGIWVQRVDLIKREVQLKLKRDFNKNVMRMLAGRPGELVPRDEAWVAVESRWQKEHVLKVLGIGKNSS